MAAAQGRAVKILDVNVLVHAHRRDAQHHAVCRQLLDRPAPAEEIGLTMPVVNGFLRVVTHPKLLQPPTPLAHALHTVAEWAARPNVHWIAPGEHHWRVFHDLCLRYQAAGGAFYDLHLAALAIERDAELVSLDMGFARIAELRWRSPA
jgi:toxin-antitoxin system PIN domain toxin